MPRPPSQMLTQRGDQSSSAESSAESSARNAADARAKTQRRARDNAPHTHARAKTPRASAFAAFAAFAAVACATSVRAWRFRAQLIPARDCAACPRRRQRDFSASAHARSI